VPSREQVNPITAMLTCTYIFNGDIQSNSCFHVHLSRSVKWLALLFTITSRAALGPLLLAGGQSWLFLAGAKDKNTQGFTFAPLLAYIPFLQGKKDDRATFILYVCVFCPTSTYKKSNQISRKLVWALCHAFHLQGWYTYLSGENNTNIWGFILVA
jgi:hypothetical protein